jgi:hypothetical protein
MADYTQPAAATQRVRFFDGQFLIDQDFVDEQKYHLDRERRLGKILRVTGIVDGLGVAAAGASTVVVRVGTAIDRDGRQLVLVQERKVALPAAFSDKGIQVLMLYREVAVDVATTGSKSERRWLEEPQIVAVTTDGQSTEKIWNDTLPTVVLASLRLDNKGTVTVDSTTAQVAGLRLPGAAGIGGADPGALKLSVNGRSRLGGTADYAADTVLSVAPGTVQFDAPNVPGGRLKIDGSTGYVGIGVGADAPRTSLDTGPSVLSGAVNDYMKAQFTMSGGGTVTWGGRGGRLKWTTRFIAISMESGKTFSSGYVDINQPTTAIAAANVYDGRDRVADATGVLLNDWEALYAVHRVGGAYTEVSGFQVRRYTAAFSAPTNWILVAVVNGDDNTVKLGTGVILAARSSSSRGSPLPTGTILMWSGAADAIPDGWALCNGRNGTPDLQSRFVMGAGSVSTQGQFGEPDQHSHQIFIPDSTFTTTPAGNHQHAPPPDWYERNFLEGGGIHSIDRGANAVGQARTGWSGDHTHSVVAKSPPFESAPTVGNMNRPRWYALCFIMKV